MKKFKFYALAFAAIAFAGCSDDVIDGQGASGTQGDGTPAYLTISFTANGGNSSRSTADDANNKGDQDGDREDSKHHSDGIDGESDINNILVVVAPSEGSSATGLVKLYTVADEATAGPDNFVETNTTTKTYTMAEPATVTTGDYKVLVIVNPSKKLKGSNADFEKMDAKTLYNDILSGQYSYTTDPAANPDNYEYENAANSIGMGVGYDGSLEEDETGSFMMANKAEASVTLNQTNENTPAKVNVDVERVLSKITFRSKPANEAEKTGENVYKVEGVKIGSAPAKTVPGCTLSDKQSGTYTLNIATDALGKTIYALYNDNGFVAAYRAPKDQESAYQLLTAVSTANWETTENKEASYAVIDVNPEDGELTAAEKADIDLEFDPDAEVKTDDWYVRLEGYALVNLSKSVNYVRHTVTGDVVIPFGTLDGTNFLWTPNWGAKNDITFVADANGEMQFPTGVTTDDWFYNTLAKVSEESADLQISTTGDTRTFSLPTGTVQYFKTFASMYNDDSAVENVEGGTGHYTDLTDNTPAVGKLMSYCFENSTDIEHQTHGLSTGITFVATIWDDPECKTAISRLYLYKGHNYTSIDQMKEAYGDAVPDAIKDLTDKSSKEDLEKAGVKLYNSNICYYYTTEIKHYDNNQPNVLGNMEFAIMRNNIYSLSVSTITQIGDPIVDPTPGTENESEEAKLEVSAKILPWIVRYNDIEF